MMRDMKTLRKINGLAPRIYTKEPQCDLRSKCGGLFPRKLVFANATCVLLVILMGLPVMGFSSIALGSEVDEEPEDFNYVHLWASADGVTHINASCKMKGFTLQAYALQPQYLRSDFGGSPEKMVFTELPINFSQGLHSPPAVQFVADIGGSWYIETTDGSSYNFQPGEVLFQDNTVTSPASSVPQHSSGVNGDVPCKQFILQTNRTAEVDNPCPFN